MGRRLSFVSVQFESLASFCQSDWQRCHHRSAATAPSHDTEAGKVQRSIGLISIN